MPSEEVWVCALDSEPEVVACGGADHDQTAAQHHVRCPVVAAESDVRKRGILPVVHRLPTAAE